MKREIAEVEICHQPAKSCNCVSDFMWITSYTRLVTRVDRLLAC